MAEPSALLEPDPGTIHSTSTPFFIQAGVLARYSKNDDPRAEPGFRVVIDTLHRNIFLQREFFSQLPHLSWAQILFDENFLDEPPARESGPRTVIHRWYAQEYLCYVADRVPHLLVQHVELLDKKSPFVENAIYALPRVPPEHVAKIIPILCELADNPNVSLGIVESIHNLAMYMASQGHSGAFDLIRAVAMPYSSTDVKKVDISSDTEASESNRDVLVLNADAISQFPHIWYDDEQRQKTLDQLLTLDSSKACLLFEGLLVRALEIEAASEGHPGYAKISFWREAVEETGQDIMQDYKSVLLSALRYCFEKAVDTDTAFVERSLARYLEADIHILKRLALHILSFQPTYFPRLLTTEFLRETNIDDTSIKHEYFGLLRNGFPTLEAKDQKTFIGFVLKETSEERRQKYLQRVQFWFGEKEEDEELVEARVRQYAEYWQRDRLQMLQDHITQNAHPEAYARWQELTAKIGKAEHPEFNSFTTGAFFVQDVSPLTDEELGQLSPSNLVQYVREWLPGQNSLDGTTETTFDGLAAALARLMRQDPEKYQSKLFEIGKARAEYADAILRMALPSLNPDSRDESIEETPTIPLESKPLWSMRLDFCEALLGNQEIAKSTERGLNGDWPATRRSIINLLHSGIKRALRAKDDALPTEYMPRVKALLLQSLDDPDPTPKDDRPMEGWVGYKDPLHVSINHVRPCALAALIDWAVLNSPLVEAPIDSQDNDTHSVRYLPPEVKDAIARKLDRSQETSPSIYSVLGRGLTSLYELDKDWVIDHLSQIFPEEEDEDSKNYFSAAWESYVLFCPCIITSLFHALKPIYERAIKFVGEGRLNDNHMNKVRALADHCVFEYFKESEDFTALSARSCLLVQFFSHTRPEDRDWAAQCVVSRLKAAGQNESTLWWIKAKSVWQWRADLAIASGHSEDHDEEMAAFADILELVPAEETIESLGNLVQAFVPHLQRRHRGPRLWEKMERFVHREIGHAPQRAIALYKMMYETGRRPTWSRSTMERDILEKALASPSSYDAAIALLDAMLRDGQAAPYEDLLDKHIR